MSFNKCIEVEPENADGYAMRANIYLQYKNDYELAVQEYTKAIELETQERMLGLYYTNRGIAYMFNGEPEKAKLDFEKAIEMGNEQAQQFLRQLPKTN